jgi:V-type H+-transporting ATPase subunit H
MYILNEGCRRQERLSKTSLTMAEETLQSLVSWLTSRLQSSHSMSLGVVTPVLVVLGTCPSARTLFDRAGGIGYLSRHLRPVKGVVVRRTTSATPLSPKRLYSSSTSGSNGHLASSYPPVSPSLNNGTGRRRIMSFGLHSSAQQMYELCFCLWTMTYDCSHDVDMKQHFARDGAVAALSEIIASAPREKVIRLALSSLRRLAEIDAKLFVPEMIACRVLKSVDLLSDQKQWTDPDMTEGRS